ncbi:MAG TPA: hypothetical protein DDX29_00205 [Clostridiales bacterium]|uniref:Uncharacterized protein n=1 Tax=Anaerolinea thermophila TaxID=167964 RepID=A0A101FXY2_9CHLR|nr:MAG: hypothetical protein XD73_0715 [Anaerolinea thermophila]HBH11536.1 hypothetical protein [Clostridiales bacterium]
MLIYLALFLYSITPVAIFFLSYRKKDEGQTWLAALFCCFVGFVLIFLSPVSKTAGDDPSVWFASSSLVLTTNPAWGNTDWLLMVLLGLSTLAFILKAYLDREKTGFTSRKIIFLFATTSVGLISLITHQMFFLLFAVFLLDCIQLVYQFSENRELFSTRGQVIPLILKLSSVIAMGYLAILNVSQESNGGSTNPLLPIIVIILFRLLAEFLQRITQSKEPDYSDQWMLSLNTTVLLKMLSLVRYPVASSLTASRVILIIFLIIGILLLYLWILRSDTKMKDVFTSGISITLAVTFFSLGARQELVVLILPMIFSLVNLIIAGRKKSLKYLQLGVEVLFMIGFPFSPWYVLNKVLFSSNESTTILVLVLVAEGLYLAGFLINQVKTILKKDRTVDGYQTNTENNSLSWFLMAILIGILLRGFVPFESWMPINWLNLLPAAFSLLVPVYFSILRKNKVLLPTNAARLSSGMRILDGGTQIALVIVNIFRQVFEGLSALLEGDGGLVWAVILLILLLTLYRGLVG